MENSIFLGISRQMALQTNMSIVANNIANMNTHGYRAQNALFQEYISDPRGADDPLSFAYDYGQYKNTASGPLQRTGNELNIALNGPGFIGVTREDGSTGYTRDGNFQRNINGEIVNSSGLAIQGRGGGSITIPNDATEIKIDERGRVSTQNGIIGELNIVEFANLQELTPLGDNLYLTDQATQDAEETQVAQGFLEGSNVSPVSEVTKMIGILRSFQSTQRMLDTEHDRLRQTIQTLTEV